MEVIKVYRTPWINMFFAFCSFAAVAGGFWIFRVQTDLFSRIFAWILIIISGLSGLYLLYITLRGWGKKIPFLVISDESVTINTHKSQVFGFADIKSFRLFSIESQKMIAIDYKEDVGARKMSKAKNLGLFLRKRNIDICGAQEAIAANYLSIKPEALLDLLNERLDAYNKKARG